MNNTVCMVTGATAGIGKATAFGLAKQGATVIIVGRNGEKAEQVAAEIRQRVGNVDVVPMIADFASLEQVLNLARECHRRYTRLDVLINNAAVVTQTRQESQDGLELMFAVNYLAPFLLTNQLLDLLRKGVPSRIVNVSSFGYKQSAIQFDDLQYVHQFSHRQAYYQTRLAMVLFTLTLARRLEGTGITVNCLHPGIVKTNLSYNYMANPFFRFFEQVIAATPEKGAEPSLYLATSPDVAGITGKYFERKSMKPVSDTASHQGLQERLWEVSESLIEQYASIVK
ncbi:MAG: SDR family oxidoreductase [Chloroflexi bacterium AL-W]|nr:SDR family oxidoreductase [Chloroflexi bacterium AL-N1]NOK65007.1 SDR family oxidoreductase [Chloroflexi bacterium AL-N10]NOK76777.1 SDR family oxidoreductase [Chloroflexi bacterium AL-N5]NOK84669.1 SDR family oxidoreductase [Chloroflexi bacterium AL-W]NOK86507.1 SDR family oxidoreductase [Chloroflexi bacterium AL-N15]